METIGKWTPKFDAGDETNPTGYDLTGGVVYDNQQAIHALTTVDNDPDWNAEEPDDKITGDFIWQTRKLAVQAD